MPPEPLPWDRKDFFKERKHERSESLGSVARWRDSSHHRDFNRWGSAEFRRPPGHGKQGGWHLFSEESGHGYAISRSSSDKMLEEDIRPSISRGDGKYGRSSRENRGGGPFGQRDWRGHLWEPGNGSVNLPRRPQDVNNDQRSVDDALAYSSHPHSDFGNAWDQHHLKDQHDKMGGVNGLGTGPRCDRENSLGDWKPLKWTRSGSLSSRGSGFSHSSSSRSMGGADSHEAKAELQPKSAAANETHSGEAAACATSSVPSEDTTSRKKPRLNWGEGLAKYEKKKVEVPDVSANKDGLVLSTSNTEPCNFLSPSLVDKSPKVTGFSECASPATPSSVACSSSPGMDDKLFGKTANVENDVSNLTGSPAPVSENHLQRFSFNLEKIDIDSLNNLRSSIIELVQSDDPTSVDSGPMRSNAINKLLIWKADISKVLEMTESEIDLLENEMKLLKSESGDTSPCPVALGSQMVGSDEKSSEEQVGVSDQVIRLVPLKIVDDPNMEKMPLSTNLHSIDENGKEEEIDSPGTATSKFVEPLPLIKAVSCDTRGYDNFSRDLDAAQSTAVKCLVPCTTRKDASVSAYVDGNTTMELKADSMDILYHTIISSNKESAHRASEVFAKLLPKDCCKIGKMGASSDTGTDTFIMEKFAEKKRFARFKERVVALKFRALHHLWKEDMRLLSIRKCRPKSHKKNELSVRTTCNGNQKNRSSIRSRFPFPVGNQLSLVPTSEIINFTSKLLSESQVKVQRNNLKMPALILDEKEKMISKFVSSNGLVEDPLAIEKERAMINPWTSEEREVFLEKFAAFGKDFRKIASFLDHRTTADCVEFYYKNHKSDCFEKLKKQDVGKLGKSFSAKTDLVASGKKWNCELNAASLEILSAASLMADGIAGNKKMRARSSLLGGYGKVKTSRVEDFIEKSSSFDILGDERETAAAADVLAGICGSLSSEAMSSCITSSVDPVEGNRDRKFLKVNPLCKPPMTPDVTQDVDDETCSDESCGEMDPTDWTDDEKAAFLQAVSSFGKDFAKIARCVGTRSQEQCKVFFSKGRKCLGLDLMRPIPENVGSPVNDDANGGESDTDDACVVETGSVVGTDKSGTKTDEDLPLYGMNTFHDESNPVEARNLSAELNESKETNGMEVDLEDANVVSDACAINIECKQGCDGSEVVLCGSDKSGSVSGQAAIIMSDSTEVGKDKASKLKGAATELISAPDISEPCESNSFAEDRMVVSEVSSGGLVNELERQRVSSPRCLGDRDNKHEADSGIIVDLKSSVHDLSPMVNASLSSLGNSCSGLSFSTENKHVPLGKPHVSASSMEDLHATSNSLLQNTVAVDVQCEKTVSQDRLSSTCDIQGSRDMHCQNSISNGDHQLPITGSSSDHVDVSILQGYPLQIPIKTEINGDMNLSSSATELPLLSQKIEQADDHIKAFQSSDSDKTSRNGDVKLFGKILTNPSSAQKPNVGAKGSEENGTHHPKLSGKSSGLKFTGHHSADGNLKILKFDRNDYVGLENVPMRSYGYWDGNRIQTGLSSLPDSAILLAKYPAAFSNYPTSSAKLEQPSLQAFSKNNERLLNGASTYTTRDINGSNAVIDYQMFRRDGPKVQPFMVDVKHCQDVFSEMQKINGFEAISSLQQQGRGVMGMNGVGRPGILVGGSCSGVSDPVAAIKMHYSNSDKYGGQTGSIAREDESWAGEGD
ncbi:Nuclear receptor corepressor 1 [Spatholobus suberectus]|nr:Nuclear receptor corepressor 1 [Spatholobus suberectus]